jgi:hypothetical protein
MFGSNLNTEVFLADAELGLGWSFHADHAPVI